MAKFASPVTAAIKKKMTQFCIYTCITLHMCVPFYIEKYSIPLCLDVGGSVLIITPDSMVRLTALLQCNVLHTGWLFMYVSLLKYHIPADI